MSYNSFSDNDDDLFSDSPSFISPSSNHTPSQFQSFIDNVSSSEDDSDDFFDSLLFRAKVALTLYDGANSFIFGTTSYNRTIFNTLNYLTNNKFQYDLYADVLEESITRRLIILDFVKTMLDDSNNEILEKISQLTKTNIDQKFLNTYFISFGKILDHSINMNIDLYQKVCQEINRPPMSSILDRNTEDTQNCLSSDAYINNVFSNIRKAYSNG